VGVGIVTMNGIVGGRRYAHFTFDDDIIRRMTTRKRGSGCLPLYEYSTMTTMCKTPKRSDRLVQVRYVPSL
jgi:hypothetical protein